MELDVDYFQLICINAVAQVVDVVNRLLEKLKVFSVDCHWQISISLGNDVTVHLV